MDFRMRCFHSIFIHLYVLEVPKTLVFYNNQLTTSLKTNTNLNLLSSYIKTNLFDTRDSNFIVEAAVASLLDDVIINFSAAEHQLLHSSRVVAGSTTFGDYPLELSAWKHVVK